MLGLCHGKKTGVTTNKKEKVPKRMSGKQKINSMNIKEDANEKKINIVMLFFSLLIPFSFLFFILPSVSLYPSLS